jgi:ribonuclease P protein component
MERRLRLRDSADIKRVRGRGLAVAEGPLLAKVLPNRLEPAQNRYQVVAGKKQGNAVKRNRVKRLVREALRHLDPSLIPGVDLLILVRGKAEEIPDYAAARALLDRIVAKAGLAGAPAGASRAVEQSTSREGERAAAAADPSRKDGGSKKRPGPASPTAYAVPSAPAASAASAASASPASPASPEDAR